MRVRGGNVGPACHTCHIPHPLWQRDFVTRWQDAKSTAARKRATLVRRLLCSKEYREIREFRDRLARIVFGAHSWKYLNPIIPLMTLGDSAECSTTTPTTHWYILRYTYIYKYICILRDTHSDTRRYLLVWVDTDARRDSQILIFTHIDLYINIWSICRLLVGSHRAQRSEDCSR